MMDKGLNGRGPRRHGNKGSEHQKNGYHKGKQQQQQQQHVDVDVLSYKPHKTLLIHLTEATPTWHECGRSTTSRDDTLFSVNSGSGSGSGSGNDKNQKQKPRKNSNATIVKYRQLADSIYQQEVSLFRANAANSRDEAWVENTMKRGTLKDRIAAMSVVVSSSPVHKLYALDMLLDLAGVSMVEGKYSGQTNERVASMAAEALTDLFTNTLIPNHRKLIGLESRPLYQYEETHSKTRKSISPRILLLWRYEEIMKSKYSAFLSQYLGKTLSQSSTSSESMTKVNALRTACSLLKDVPEGEQLLLSLIANKVGDPQKKIAGVASHELRRILEVHPNMTGIIAREVQQLAHRPNLSTKALYNCIIFLNQLKLVKEEPLKNINIEQDAKKGPKQKQKSSLPASLINTYFQIFEFAVNKTLNKDKKKSKIQLNDAMKSRLLGALLTGVNRAHPYLPSDDSAMEQHIDSLYRIAHVAPPSSCTQAFMLLFHLAVGSDTNDVINSGPTVHDNDNESDDKTKKKRKDRFYRALYSKMADPTMLFGRQITLYFNLLYKSMKYDDNISRIVAFGKRLFHTAFHYNPAVTSGAIFLISEVTKIHPGLYNSALTADGHSLSFDSTTREPSAAFRLVNHSNTDEEEEKGADGNNDPSDACSMWELSLSLHHYHPSVCKFSSDIGAIEYNGDPLRDFTLAPFLDKFAFRNPKSIQKIKNKFNRGESVGERRSGLQGGKDAAMALAINDPDFWKKQKDASEQDIFFQKFFVERAKRDEIKGVVRGKKADEVDALDEAEGKEIDFDWDSDEEEEKFVQGLAEGMMKSSGEKIEYDEEDPDMDDWSDYGGSDGEEPAMDIDPSAFEGMDEEFEDDDSDDEEQNLVFRESNDGNDSDDEDQEVDFTEPTGEEDDDDDDDYDMGTFTGDLDIEEDDSANANEKGSSFAAASDFEDKINEALKKEGSSRKRSSSIGDEDDINGEETSPKKSKKKRKRAKRKKKT